MCDLTPFVTPSNNVLNSSTGSKTGTSDSSDDSDIDVTTVGDDSKFSFLPGFSIKGVAKKKSSRLSDYLKKDKHHVIKQEAKKISSGGFTIDEIMKR